MKQQLHRVFTAIGAILMVVTLVITQVPATSAEASTPAPLAVVQQLPPAPAQSGCAPATPGWAPAHASNFTLGGHTIASLWWPETSHYNGREIRTYIPSGVQLQVWNGSGSWWVYDPGTCSVDEVRRQLVDSASRAGLQVVEYFTIPSNLAVPIGPTAPGQQPSPGQPCGYPGQPSCGQQPAPPPGTPPSQGDCQVTSQYLFDPTGNTLSMSGASHIHVEYRVDDLPEVETFLPTYATSTTHWSFTPDVAAAGRVWYLSGCTDQEVIARINDRINARREISVRNDGYRHWRDTFFQPNAALGRSGITPIPSTPAPGQPIACDPFKNTRVFFRAQTGDTGEVYSVVGPSVVKAFFWDDNTFLNGVAVLLSSSGRAVISRPRIVETWSLPHPDCPFLRLQEAYNEVINRQGAAPYWDVRGQVPGMTVTP